MDEKLTLKGSLASPTSITWKGTSYFCASPYIEVGQNIGLGGLKLFWHVILPSALPYLITCFEISWARSWRAAIAVELVFGAATTSGGIGWTIYMSYFDMETALMIAAIMTIAVMGVLAEKLGMEDLEKKTVLKWGMIQKTETIGAQKGKDPELNHSNSRHLFSKPYLLKPPYIFNRSTKKAHPQVR